MNRPTIRLRPKRGHRFAAGFPWLYADELVLDRRTRTLAPGSVVTLQSPDREPLATVAFNAASGIAARFLDSDPSAAIDESWIAARLEQARALRDTAVGGAFYRLCHAEADGLPGLIVDRFEDVLAVQPNTAWADAMLPQILKGLEQNLRPRAVVVNRDGRGRAQEGMAGSEERALAAGSLESPVEVVENGAVYLADLLNGQKTGHYFDQRDNHGFAARLSPGRSVLDVFSHAGGFSMACLAGGASSALAVDSSAPALALAEEAALRNGFADRFRASRDDAIAAMRNMTSEGRRFDMVICDPPAFAPSKGSLQSGLRAYERTARAALPLVGEAGFLVFCSCSHAVTADALREIVHDAVARAGRTARVIRSAGAGADHPVHSALPESGYLKALFFALN